MSERPVLIFGAGATRACGGPLTAELLPGFARYVAEEGIFDADDALAKPMADLARFLREAFHLDVDDGWKVAEAAHYPAIPLLLSLVDLAVDRGQPLGSWGPDALRDIRTALQAVIILAVDLPLMERKDAFGPYRRLLEPLYREDAPAGPTVITLNYDTLVDKAMVQLSGDAQRRIPDYGCDLVVPDAPAVPRFGTLLKLHGSLNWLYCRRCARLTLHMSGLEDAQGFWAGLADSLNDLQVIFTLEESAECERCEGLLGPLLITPSHLKDYRNPHVSRIWYEAEQALRGADRAIFVGYSMPWDDVDVIYLLKRGLEHLPPNRITVVEYSGTPVRASEHDVGRRYLSMFGKEIDWCALGFSGWLDACEERGVSPLA